MRQVFVKVVPPAILVLSGMVTSVTNRALLVQSGGLVGIEGSTVGVDDVSGVSVTATVGEGAVVAASVVAGASVMEMSAVASGGSVEVEAEGSVAVPPLQADRASVINAVTMNSFLTILSLLCDHVKPNCSFVSVLEHRHLGLRFFQRITGNLFFEYFTRQHRQLGQRA